MHEILSRAWSSGNNFRIREDNGVVVYCPSEVSIGSLEAITNNLDKLEFPVTFVGTQNVSIHYAFDPVNDPKHINRFFKQYMPGCKNISLNLRFRSFKEMRKIDLEVARLERQLSCGRPVKKYQNLPQRLQSGSLTRTGLKSILVSTIERPYLINRRNVRKLRK